MYWYASKPNEIFIDTDNYERSVKHTAMRLVGAMKSGRLQVASIEQHESSSESHIHTLITLKDEMPAMERYVWSIVLHSDIYRAASTMMREIRYIAAPDVLITPKRFRREPDDECPCVDKHKAAVMAKCPAALRLRGEDVVVGFFGLPDNSAENLLDAIKYLESGD